MRPFELATVRTASKVFGALPDHVGQFRLAQRYWLLRRPPHHLVRQRLVGGTELELDLGDRTQALAYLTRRYSPELVAQIVEALPPVGVFVDAGANVGLITFQVARQRPNARIIAFEPQPSAAKGWRRNRRLHPDVSTTLETIALTNRAGTVAIDSPIADLGAGRLVHTAGGVPVPATTLDAYCAAHGIDRIDVLKLDVEGSEPEALEGMSELLTSRAVRRLIVELNDGHLDRRGWSRRTMIDFLGSGGMVPCSPMDRTDVVFAPDGAG